ncbi:MAG: NACHT domain-containing protein [Bacteroidota bacterium]
MIDTFIYKKILDEAYKLVRKHFETALDKTSKEEEKPKLISTVEEVYDSYEKHLKIIRTWSSEISFRGMLRSKVVTRIYIDLKYFLTPRKDHLNSSEPKVHLDSVVDTKNNLVILGHPGAGKTTTIKHICQELLSSDQKNEDPQQILFLIRLRDLNNFLIEDDLEATPIQAKLISIMGLKFHFDESLNSVKKSEFMIETLEVILEKLELVIILDGFDELKNELKKLCLNEIRKLSLLLEESKLILTSRSSDFDYHIENAKHYEICPLDEVQIRDFCMKWINNEIEANNLLKQIESSPYKDSSDKPLNLANLCALYERYGSIPSRPKTVYRKIVNLAVEEWDVQRSVKRFSRYSNFEADRQLDFLQNLAYVLTIEHEAYNFHRGLLEETYKEICQNFSLPKVEFKNVINELESHNGLFIQTGYDQWEFAHKSIQEYLTAEYMIKLPYTIDNVNISKFPDELAVATALSSEPSYLFCKLTLRKYISELNNVLIPYLVRIISEKPDFNHLPFLGVAGLALFSNNYLWDSGNDHLIDNFLNMHPAIESSIQEVSLFYNFENHKEFENYYQLTLDSSKSIDKFEFEMPGSIIAKKDLFT